MDSKKPQPKTSEVNYAIERPAATRMAKSKDVFQVIVEFVPDFKQVQVQQVS